MSKSIPWTSPCCPNCQAVGVVVERSPREEEPERPPADGCVLSVWSDGQSGWGSTHVGAWTLLCGVCDGHVEGYAEHPWPTVRSQTPPVVLAALGVARG